MYKYNDSILPKYQDVLIYQNASQHRFLALRTHNPLQSVLVFAQRSHDIVFKWKKLLKNLFTIPAQQQTDTFRD